MQDAGRRSTLRVFRGRSTPPPRQIKQPWWRRSIAVTSLSPQPDQSLGRSWIIASRQSARITASTARCSISVTSSATTVSISCRRDPFSNRQARETPAGDRVRRAVRGAPIRASEPWVIDRDGAAQSTLMLRGPALHRPDDADSHDGCDDAADVHTHSDACPWQLVPAVAARGVASRPRPRPRPGGWRVNHPQSAGSGPAARPRPVCLASALPATPQGRCWKGVLYV